MCVDEQWVSIPNYEGLYEVSTLGNIRSVDHETIATNGVTRRYKGKSLNPFKFKTGHLQVKLSKNGKQETRWVHQLVMLAFIGPMEDGKVVRHLNDVPHDNRLENLAYGTQAENMQDMIRNNGSAHRKLTHCPHGHLLQDPNLAASFKKRGYRACLSCARARSRIYRHPDWKPRFKQLADEYYKTLMEV